MGSAPAARDPETLARMRVPHPATDQSWRPFDAASLLDLDRIHRRRAGARRRRSRRLRHLARRQARRSSRCARWGRPTCTCASSPSRVSTTSTTRRSPTPSTSPTCAAARSTRQHGGRRGGRRRRERQEVPGRRHRRHALQRRARQLRLSAAHLGLRPARLDRLVRRGGGGRRLAAGAGAARVRAQPVGDRRAAAARADRVSHVAPRARHVPGEGGRASARRC